MKKQLTIKIEGEPKSGKSRTIYLIKEILKIHGFDVQFDPMPDYENEKQFNTAMRSDMDLAIEQITQKTNITIIESNKI